MSEALKFIFSDQWVYLGFTMWIVLVIFLAKVDLK